MIFEFPETSRLAFVVAVWSVLMTLLSIILFCVETLPTYGFTPLDLPFITLAL